MEQSYTIVVPREKGRNKLRITHEADYAIRVTYCLALTGGKQCAKDISELTGVTLRFALKIDRRSIRGVTPVRRKAKSISMEAMFL